MGTSDVLLCYQGKAEQWDIILLITRRTKEHGSRAFIEFWAEVGRMFLSDAWVNEDEWQQEAAARLGISWSAFRQRKHQFIRWIEPVLIDAGYAWRKQRKEERLAA